MRTPKENREQWYDDKINISVMINKFSYGRYKFMGETFRYIVDDDKDWGFNIDIYLDEGVRINICCETSYYITEYCEYQLCADDFIALGGKRIKSLKNYKDEYWNIMEYFAHVENIISAIQYCEDIYNFLYTTTYLPSLPLAYTFLLCNRTKKQFPKEIAKLITQKLLFFLF